MKNQDERAMYVLQLFDGGKSQPIPNPQVLSSVVLLSVRGLVLGWHVTPPVGVVGRVVALLLVPLLCLATLGVLISFTRQAVIKALLVVLVESGSFGGFLIGMV